MVFFVVAMAFLAFTVIGPMLVRSNRGRERHLFWIGVIGIAVSVFCAGLPYWKQSIAMSLFALAFMTASAYRDSSYIKIRGRIYAFHAWDREPDSPPDGAAAPGINDPNDIAVTNAYSNTLTAPKYWTLLILMVVICVGCILLPDPHKPWLLVPGAVTALVLLAFGTGYRDGSWDYRTARGQYIQFVILAIMTAAAFTVVYLIAYSAGRRWPLRRQDSFEYRTRYRNTP